MDFETSVKRLEEITSALEKENVSLEEALKLYEEGVRLVRICNEKLEDAERRIRILKMTSEGEMVEEEFSAALPEGGERI